MLSSVPRTDDTTADKIQSHCQHRDGAHRGRRAGALSRCRDNVSFIRPSLGLSTVNLQSIFVEEAKKQLGETFFVDLLLLAWGQMALVSPTQDTHPRKLCPQGLWGAPQ